MRLINQAGKIAADEAPPAPPTAERPPGVTLGVYITEDTDGGVLVDRVVEDSPAERAGIKQGDRVLKIGDTLIDSTYKLLDVLGGLHRGDKTSIVLKRGTEEVTVQVRFGRGRADRRPRSWS